MQINCIMNFQSNVGTLKCNRNINVKQNHVSIEHTFLEIKFHFEKLFCGERNQNFPMNETNQQL